MNRTALFVCLCVRCMGQGTLRQGGYRIKAQQCGACTFTSIQVLFSHFMSYSRYFFMYFCLRQKASVPHRDEHEKSLTGCVMGNFAK